MSGDCDLKARFSLDRPPRQYRGNTGLEVTVCEWFWCNSQDCVEWDDELHVCLRLAASCVSTTMLPGRWGYDVGATKLGVFKYKVFASDSR